ncbi:hypothetical protein GOV03_02230 [Candidatus Woesearchaeota archaeon]|nr:hypothetical protein [Candidatus Woesearchaeota archaeon]
MHPKKKEELLKKGWEEAEIKNAENILDKVELHDLFFSKITFWSALVVIIFANLLISLVLIPFLIVLASWILYSTVAILALIIGFLYDLLITDIKILERKHHLLAGITIPLLAFINIIIMVLVSNKFITDLHLYNSPHNPWLLGLVFAIALITPYLIARIKGKHQFQEV